MKFIALGFGNNNTAKEIAKNYVAYNVAYTLDTTTGYKVKAITSKKNNITGFEVYRIGSSAKVHEVDAIKGLAYDVYRGKRINEYEIWGVSSTSMFRQMNPNIEKGEK